MRGAEADQRGAERSVGRAAMLVPALAWMRGVGGVQLRGDLLAGVTLAAYVLPSALGVASLARLPPESGLYACIFGGLVFWCLCGSRYTVVTVTSSISLVMGVSLGAMTNGDSSRYVALAGGTALLMSALAFCAWLFKAGSLVSFISETVMLGFKAGVALTLASTQLPTLLGISGVHGGFWECLRHLVAHLGETNVASLELGLGALVILILGKVFLKNRPVALFVVIAGIVVASLADLGASGVQLLGEVPGGWPPVGLPTIGWSDLNELLPLAMACFLLGAVETVAIGRMFASKSGVRLDANQEFLALAGANLAAGLGHGFPVSGGMSQSLVNEGAGARTPLSGLAAAGLMLVVAVYFSGVLRNLPQPVLAAVILMAVTGLVNVSVVRKLWASDRMELVTAGAALAGVLASGLLRGVLIGSVISLLLLVRRASRMHVAFLGRIPGSRRYSDMERHPDNLPVAGVLIFRPEGALVYFTAEHVHDAVMARVRSETVPMKTVVCDLSGSSILDLAGAEMLKGLCAELEQIGVRLHIVEARSQVRDKLRSEGVEGSIGRIDRFTTVADAVEEALGEPGAQGPRVPDGMAASRGPVRYDRGLSDGDALG